MYKKVPTTETIPYHVAALESLGQRVEEPEGYTKIPPSYFGAWSYFLLAQTFLKLASNVYFGVLMPVIAISVWRVYDTFMIFVYLGHLES